MAKPGQPRSPTPAMDTDLRWDVELGVDKIVGLCGITGFLENKPGAHKQLAYLLWVIKDIAEEVQALLNDTTASA